MLMNKNEDEYYQAYLTSLYQATSSYQNVSVAENEALQKKNVCLTYGELLYFSVQKILQKLAPKETDIFLDLGSGLGKCALQVFMQSNLNKVIGIEAATPLVEQAEKVKQKFKQEFPECWDENRELAFYSDNFLSHSWYNANLIYTCSTCFTQELLDAIGEKINQETQVEQVLSLRPLPTLKRLRLKEVFGVECSWDSTLCFHYSLF